MLGLSGCGTIYYGTMEKLGIHKRDIMVDRVKAARDTQNEAKDQFLTAMDQFKSVVNFQGGDLEREYNKLNATLQKSEAKAAEVRSRIQAVEDVSAALFGEWRAEIKQYASDTLRKSSQRKYDATKEKYAELIEAMQKAESKLDPALVPLRDQVLFKMTGKNLAMLMEWLRPAGVGLANAATAITAGLVYFLDWGRYADATIVTV